MNFNNGKLKILQLTDIHYENGADGDIKTLDLIDRMIKSENPDLIFMTGDIITNLDDPHREKLADGALKVITKTETPWCFVFGNHDREDICDAKALYKTLIKLPGCIQPMDSGVVPGEANFSLEIRDGSGKLKWLLVGIDSNMYNALDMVEGYGYIQYEQITWFREMIDDYEKREGKDFACLVFMHIPLPEYNDAFEKGEVKGEKNEDICCPDINSGFFTTLLEKGHTKGVFAGHDHINDFDARYYGIRLVYGRATGYSTYSMEGYKHGGRVIIIDESNLNDFESYQVLEDGTIVR